jgi:hypothetical protein
MSSVATLTELTPAERLELLKMVRARDLARDRSELPPIERAAREGRLLLSSAQERLWFIDRMEPGSPVYNIPVACGEASAGVGGGAGTLGRAGAAVGRRGDGASQQGLSSHPNR